MFKFYQSITPVIHQICGEYWGEKKKLFSDNTINNFQM